MNKPRLFLTSMCQSHQYENIVEMVGPVFEWLDGIVWVLNDCEPEDVGACYLEQVKGCGRVVHRPWSPGRHHHAMNDTLYCGGIEEGDWVLYCDVLERPMPAFVSRIKAEVGPMMQENDLDVLFYHGKAYLLRYRETMEYRGSPHWWLAGHNGRAMEWAKIEPDESKVRLNVRPERRADQPYHWVSHYARYYVEYPAGTNQTQLGIEIYAQGGDVNAAHAERESRRLSFRWLMKERGYPVTMEGLKRMLTGPLDDKLKEYLRAEKTLSDVYHYWGGRGAELKDTHKPGDALPIV